MSIFLFVALFIILCLITGKSSSSETLPEIDPIPQQTTQESLVLPSISPHIESLKTISKTLDSPAQDPIQQSPQHFEFEPDYPGIETEIAVADQPVDYTVVFEPTTVDYNTYTCKQLIKMLKPFGIKNLHKKRKAQLVALAQEHNA